MNITAAHVATPNVPTPAFTAGDANALDAIRHELLEIAILAADVARRAGALALRLRARR